MSKGPLDQMYSVQSPRASWRPPRTSCMSAVSFTPFATNGQLELGEDEVQFVCAAGKATCRIQRAFFAYECLFNDATAEQQEIDFKSSFANNSQLEQGEAGCPFPAGSLVPPGSKPVHGQQAVEPKAAGLIAGAGAVPSSGRPHQVVSCTRLPA